MNSNGATIEHAVHIPSGLYLRLPNWGMWSRKIVWLLTWQRLYMRKRAWTTRMFGVPDACLEAASVAVRQKTLKSERCGMYECRGARKWKWC